MKKIIIGIPGWKLGENSFGATSHYIEYIRSFDCIPKILHPDEEFATIDMLLLPGGPDVNPSCYDEVPQLYTSNPDLFRQFFFDKRLANYVGKVPIIGICLGFQMLNIFFKGKLTQNINNHASEKRFEEAHNIVLVKNRIHNGLTKSNKPYVTAVNSHHHQGVLLNQLAPELQLIAVCNDKDGYDSQVVEAFIHKELPIVGIQWHPEEFYDDVSTLLMNWLINQTSK